VKEKRRREKRGERRGGEEGKKIISSKTHVHDTHGLFER